MWILDIHKTMMTILYFAKHITNLIIYLMKKNIYLQLGKLFFPSDIEKCYTWMFNGILYQSSSRNLNFLTKYNIYKFFRHNDTFENLYDYVSIIYTQTVLTPCVCRISYQTIFFLARVNTCRPTT